MHKLNTHKVGLTLGLFVGLLHLVWALVVGLGFAESKLSFALGMHFLSNPFTVTSFSWGGALILVVLSSVGGYIIGNVFAFIWNSVNR